MHALLSCCLKFTNCSIFIEKHALWQTQTNPTTNDVWNKINTFLYILSRMVQCFIGQIASSHPLNHGQFHVICEKRKKKEWTQPKRKKKKKNRVPATKKRITCFIFFIRIMKAPQKSIGIVRQTNENYFHFQIKWICECMLTRTNFHWIYTMRYVLSFDIVWWIVEKVACLFSNT